MAYNLGGASGLVPYTGSGDAAGTPRVFCADGSSGAVYVVNMAALAQFQAGTLIASIPAAPTIALSGVAYNSANYTLGPGTGGAPSGYQVQYRITGSGSPFANFGSVVTGLTGTITGLAASTGYDIEVTASNAAGSATSAVQTITTTAQPAQSASFTAGPASTYTQGATIGVNGTATSISQVYVSQTIGGAEQTPRTAATMSGSGPYTWSASFTAALGTGETISVYSASTGGTTLAVSSAYNVTAVTGSVSTPATVQSGNPEAVSGTCSGASTVYVSLSTGGTEQLPRTMTTVSGGNWSATLTPSGAGTYTASLWTAATGGSPVATSSSFTVTSLSGTVNPPSAGTTDVSQAFGGTATASTVYVSLSTGGAEEGARVAATVSGGNWTVALTPQTVASYTVSFYAAATGGSAVATSASFSVAAGVFPLVFSGTAGSPPTGNQAITNIAGSGEVIHAGGTGLDLQTTNGNYGLFQAAGMTGANRTVTYTYLSGTASKQILIGARSDAAGANWVSVAYNASAGQAIAYQNVSGNVSQVGSTATVGVATGSVGLALNGTTMQFLIDGAVAATWTVSVTANGYALVGQTVNSGSLTTLSKVSLY